MDHFMSYDKTMIYTLDEIEKVALDIMALRSQCAIFTFTGSLGAGKTTLIQHCLRLAGIEGVIASPTFTYVNLYTNNQDQTFYHFDLYRIATLQDFQEAGFDEYLYIANSWSFIEWPEVVMPLLEHKVCHISLEYAGADKRRAVINVVE
jgi:tRNA threonylcarbamoyladenosine biosynthesis protein TsaE